MGFNHTKMEGCDCWRVTVESSGWRASVDSKGSCTLKEWSFHSLLISLRNHLRAIPF